MTEHELLPTRQTGDEHLPGYAERCAELARSEADPATLGHTLEQQARQAGLPAPAGRGVPAAFKVLVDVLRRRRLVEELGTHPASVTWLELHVPRGGSGALKWRSSGSGEASFRLDLLGSGLGSGRTISWVMESDIGSRPTCLKFIQEITAKITLYSVPGGNGERIEPAVDVVGTRSRRLVAWPDCPWCAAAIEDVDDFDYERGEIVDLREYDGKYTETLQRELGSTRNAEIGLSIPALASLPQAGSLGVSLKRETTMSCELVYEFAAGRSYQPYWAVGEPADLPYWSTG